MATTQHRFISVDTRGDTPTVTYDTAINGHPARPGDSQPVALSAYLNDPDNNGAHGVSADWEVCGVIPGVGGYSATVILRSQR